MNNLVYYSISSFVLCACLCWLLINTRLKQILTDTANDRSLHTSPTPRSGGIAFNLTLILLIAYITYSNNYDIENIYVLSYIAIIVLGLIDDAVNLGAFTRLCVQLIAAIALSLPLLGIPEPGPASVLVFVICIITVVWIINLFNFMDGMDGLLSGMTITGFTSVAIILYLHDNTEYSVMSLVIVFTTLGFMLFNFPPAKIFMGDSGSTGIGLLVSITLFIFINNKIPVTLIVIIFSPFFVDATVTVVKRLFNGENILKPHRSHYYQKLALSGINRRSILLYEYILMILCGLSAVYLYNKPETYQYIAIIFWTLVYACIIYYIRSYLSNKAFDV